MALPRVVHAALGSVAVLTTTALLVVQIILAQSMLDPSSPVRVTAIISSIFEAFVLVALCWICSLYLGTWARDPFSNHSGVWFGLIALLCAVSAAMSAATLVSLSRLPTSSTTTIKGSKVLPYLISSAVVLVLSFTAQLLFLVVHFVLAKTSGPGQNRSLHTDEGSHRSPTMQVKSIRYSQTSPATTRLRGYSADSKSPPSSSGGRSTAETMSSIRSSLSHVVRPITSKTRLIGSTRSPRRPASLDSQAYRERHSGGDDAFDSWDTSAVDPQNRQTVLQTSGGSANGRFLETIPASPTTSRSPSPGTALDLDLEPPRTRRRSRSYSPVSMRARSYSQNAGFTQQSSASESHIHPLFRSDSPTPPPVAKPGTVVTAAPNAGQLIAADRQSIRTLSRMRSGSLPTASSPLSQQGSFEDFGRRIEREELRLPEELHEEEEEEEDGEDDSRPSGASAGEEQERKLTPPIPDWIMTAGSRTSLYGYNSRKARADDIGNKPVRK